MGSVRPNLRRWMRLPTMNSNECFVFSDKESLAVGTELLVFGKEYMAQVIYRYSLLTNSWSTGMQMNEPRCLFGSACQGEIAIMAGGCDLQGKILSSAELYNSETGEWKLLPSMNKARKMCSAVFMDGKFYVIGGIGGPETKLLTSGEEYNLETETWTEIPIMCLPPHRGNALPTTSEAPPLIAVVNDQLYAADYAEMVVKKYDKDNRVWFKIGRLPERANSMNGWGLAFRACGDKLIVIGGPRASGPGFIEVNSWVPSEGPPEWHLLGRKQSGKMVPFIDVREVSTVVTFQVEQPPCHMKIVATHQTTNLLRQQAHNPAPPPLFSPESTPESRQRFGSLRDIYETTNFALSVSDPIFYDDAAREQIWRDAMIEEMNCIQKKYTWKLVDLPEGKKSNWVEMGVP
nr:F-box/kelch-repeat protein SKIP11-like [Ipomoea batatas]